MLKIENLNRPNFKWHEFFTSGTVYRINHDAILDNNFENYPSAELEQEILQNLMFTADAMQDIWFLLFKEWKRRNSRKNIIISDHNFYIRINNGYRCEQLNLLVDGKLNSYHLQGLAIDFVCPIFGTPEDIVKFLHSINFLSDQCFIEGTWVHWSRRTPEDYDKNRMMYGYYLIDKKLKKRFFKSI